MTQEYPECDYCLNEADFLEMIASEGPEGPLQYEYYVCKEHKGTKHHDMEAIAMWNEKRGLI